MALVVLAQSQSATGAWCGFLVGPEHKQYDRYQNLPDSTDQSVMDTEDAYGPVLYRIASPFLPAFGIVAYF
jgi:hypothetical protein